MDAIGRPEHLPPRISLTRFLPRERRLNSQIREATLPTTAFRWATVLHATAFARIASAVKAVEPGHAIYADDGPSGRLRGNRRIAGIQQDACDCSPNARWRSQQHSN